MSSPPPRRSPPLSSRCAISVPREAVGFIIGRRGETVRSLSTRSGAHIAVEEDQDDLQEDQGVFNITGTQEQIQRARVLISEKVNAVLFQPPNPAVQDPVVVSTPPTRDPSAQSPTPRASSSRASSSSTPPLQLPRRPPNSNTDDPAGSPIADVAAHSTRESNGHTHSQILPPAAESAVDPSSDQPEQHVTPVPVFALSFRPLEMWIPRNMVGMIIGLNGQVISDMQDKTGATIVVHNQRKAQDGSKLLTISGTPEVQQEARRLIEQILSSDPRSRGIPGASSSRRSRGGSTYSRPVVAGRARSAAGPRQPVRSPAQQSRASEQFVTPGEPLVTTQPYGEIITQLPTDPRAQHFNPNVGTPPFTPMFRQPPERQPMPLNTRIPLAHPGAPGRPPFFAPAHNVPFVQRGPYNTIHFIQPPVARHPYVESPLVKQVRVPTSCVGIVIGKGGETIRDLQTRSGAYIKVTPDRDANEKDEERNIFISGRSEDIELAHNLLNDIVNEGLRRSYRDGVGHGQKYDGHGDEDEQFESEGSTAVAGPSSLPSTSQQTEASIGGAAEGDSKDDENEEPKELSLSIEGDYRVLRQQSTDYPSSSITIELSIPNAKVGVIIGKGGQTIRELQQQSGARIVISKMMDTTREDNPRQVKITGPVPFVEKAYTLIHAKIRGELSAEHSVATSPGASRPLSGTHEILQEAVHVPPAHYQPPINPAMAPPPIQGGQVPAGAFAGYQGQMTFVPIEQRYDPQPYQQHNLAEMHAIRSRFVQQQQAMQAVQQQVFQQQALHQYHLQQSQAQMQAQALSMQNYAAQFGVHQPPFHPPPQVGPPFVRAPQMEMPRSPPVHFPRPGFGPPDDAGDMPPEIHASTQMPQLGSQDEQGDDGAHERTQHQAHSVPFPGFFPGQYSIGFPGALPHQFPGFASGPSESMASAASQAGPSSAPSVSGPSAQASESQAEDQAAAGDAEDVDEEKPDAASERGKS